MDFATVDDVNDVRDTARRWADEHVDPAWLERQRATGSHHTPELHRMLADEGWLGAGWEPELGGSSRDPALTRAILEEVVDRGIGLDGWASTVMVCRTLVAVGLTDHHREVIAGSLRGENIIALGYSEPDSGSDVAAAKTRATWDGGEWLIDGQKMFTSTADKATHVFLLTRSDASAAKHAGLTMFLVPMSLPGVLCHPIMTLGGLLTNATFYSDIRIGDEARVGDVNGGWAVMRSALVYERGGEVPTGSSPDSTGGRETLLKKVVEWAENTVDERGHPILDDELVRHRLSRIAIDNEVSRLLGLRASWAAQVHNQSGVEGTARKLFSSESAQRAHWDYLDILGAESVLESGEGSPFDGMVDEAFRTGVVGTIRGGSSEILRDIVAERQLGLARPRQSQSDAKQ